MPRVSGSSVLLFICTTMIICRRIFMRSMVSMKRFMKLTLWMSHAVVFHDALMHWYLNGLLYTAVNCVMIGSLRVRKSL